MSLKSKLEKLPFYNDLVLPVHYAQALRAGMKYKWPAKKLRVIGVTGTNGKTTTCFMIWKMLNESGRKCGLLTTVGWSENGEKLHRQYEHMTTERVEVLNERMRKVADAGAEFLVLEVTSHALVQYRTLGVPIEIAVFTNLTHEHLDYHGTFEKYREAKMKLFRKAKSGVVNADDANSSFFEEAARSSSSRSTSSNSPVLTLRTPEYGSFRASNSPCISSKNTSRLDTEELSYASGDIITYGIHGGDVRATEVELRSDGVQYSCGDMKIRTRIPGEFNVYNSLAAVCVGKKLGLRGKEIEDGIYALKEVEGRMNLVDEGQGFKVIVDYAHTPDALEKALSSVITSSDFPVRSHRISNTAPLRASNLPRTDSKRSAFSESTKMKNTSSMHLEDGSRRVISVHGGAGRRDESTRAIRGEILGKYSDIVIITEDDSRDEDPERIAAQFVEGAEKAGKKRGEDLYVELDRRKAIEKALNEARKGDLVLILGKGHEKTILRADGAHEFEDIKVVREILKEMQ